MAKDKNEDEDQVKRDYEFRLKQVIEGGSILEYTETEVRRMCEHALTEVYRG